MRITRMICAGVALFAFIAGGCGPVGEETPTVTIAHLEVAGMTCESCEQAITETVGAIEGVQMVEARHDPGEATVSYDPAMTSVEAINEAIEAMGYTVVSSSGSGSESGGPVNS